VDREERQRERPHSLSACPISVLDTLSSANTRLADPDPSSDVTAHIILLPTVFTRISTAWAARSTMESLVSEGESGDVDSKRRIRHEECDVRGPLIKENDRCSVIPSRRKPVTR
jgi:hypothetical protein